MFKSIILTLAAIAGACAIPTGWEDHNTVSKGDTCGNGNKVHCCDSETAKQLTGAGVIPVTADLQNLLGQCNEVIPILSGLIGKQECQQQTICCGEIQQNGLVNLGCTPINL
ncbi:hypothetical protein QQS21_011832 [Conoideocrella luteorostrata]|uniref:Hydrophobin n=1 Tax=Conoideocrella luteorostrata TaxID=1105319 RepID=A0AAJ0CCC2_9HYPO|nr:hypothetical protein QQS21_011832 [Conoideocrella luteorostrata]